MEKVRVLLPEKLVEAIKERYCDGKRNYTGTGLHKAIIRFAAKPLYSFDKDLSDYYRIADNQPSLDTLYRALNVKKPFGVYCGGDKNFLNLLSYYAFEVSWDGFLRENEQKEADLISQIPTVASGSQPKLTVFDQEQNTVITIFKNISIPFVGREYELNLLKDFVDSPENFAWWLFLGEAGMGKSRLALQFCKQLLSQGVRAGFAEHAVLRNFDWDGWQPTRETFIVFDYAGTYYHEVIETIKSLQANAPDYKYKIRVLLLERRKFGEWWMELHYQLQIHSLSIWKEEHMISSMEDCQLLSIFKNAYLKKKEMHFSDEEITDVLKRTNPQNRPLFAILAADLLTEKELATSNPFLLLELYLQKENKRWKNELVKINGGTFQTLEKYKNLLAVSNILRGIPLDTLGYLLSKNYAWLPSLSDFSDEIYNIVSAVIIEEYTTTYGFMEPDIVAEYFTFYQLTKIQQNPLLNKDIITPVMEEAWYLSHEETLSFLLRLHIDLREYRNTLIAFFPLPISKTTSKQTKEYWTLASTVIVSSLINEGWFNLAKVWYLRLKEFAMNNNERELYDIMLEMVEMTLKSFFNKEDTRKKLFNINEYLNGRPSAITSANEVTQQMKELEDHIQYAEFFTGEFEWILEQTRD